MVITLRLKKSKPRALRASVSPFFWDSHHLETNKKKPLPSFLRSQHDMTNPHVISLVAQMVKRLPTMQETWVQSLGQEDLLEKAMTPHSSTLAWRIPWMEEPGGLKSMGSQRVGHDWATFLLLLLAVYLKFCFMPDLVIVGSPTVLSLLYQGSRN